MVVTRFCLFVIARDISPRVECSRPIISKAQTAPRSLYSLIRAENAFIRINLFLSCTPRLNAKRSFPRSTLLHSQIEHYFKFL